eukprot:scaffold1551_cov164-Ochromonas_danica.AAC.10
MTEDLAVSDSSASPEDFKDIDKVVKAVQHGDLKFLETAIEVYHVSVDIKDKDDCTFLHWAAINNRVQIIEFLLHQKANVNVVGGVNQEIPLQWAVRHAHCTAAVNLLLLEGSNVHHRSAYGYDALFLAVQASHLHIVYMLLQAGANANTIDSQGDTPLYWLLKHDTGHQSIDIQRLLLRFHASVTLRGHEDRVALHYIAESGRKLDLQSAFLIYMANYSNAVIGAKSAHGLTPYETAWKTRNPSALRFFFDAFMYAHLPRWVPIATSALTLFSFFPLLDHYGWLIGVLIYVILHFASDLLMQKYILRGSSRASCGFAWGVTISSTWAYYKYVSKPLNSVFWDGVIGFMAFMIVFTLWKAMNTPAQTLYCQEEDNQNSENLVLKILESSPVVDSSGRAVGINFRFCPTCLVDKSLTSTHCSQCDHCAVSLDHHCPFVNNCVGKGNRRIFVFFTLCAGVGCELMALLSLYAENYFFCQDAKGMLGGVFAVQYCALLLQPTLCCATWLAMLTGIWILFIFSGQLSMVASETTTFEVIKHGNNGLNPCTSRGFANIMRFLSTGQYYIVDPAMIPRSPCCSGHDHGSHSHRGHATVIETSSDSSTETSQFIEPAGSTTSRADHPSGQLQKLRAGVADLMLKAQMVNTKDDDEEV